ncbi:hypothetical protein GCM10011571_31150 [Marinithermofilum abyssi]|uniref:Uncharacterized protein n=1 Tax=Marinithermofilum abyssi TaxID=1571185 RepID=A0A8J2YET3_9BACL|nr:hypothetical protein [Marinithermofilum abyssi]GGE26710.1 hypothetical protein GCM10011571_31150 [Marinithermofilum abyssi]
MMVLLLMSGLVWIWVKEDTPDPGVLQVHRFNEVVPYLFDRDRLYFKGVRGHRESWYVYDLQSGNLTRKDWTRRYGDGNRVLSLNGDGRLMLNPARGELRLKGRQTRWIPNSWPTFRIL